MATPKLEHEILNWGTCFTEYISTQKAFAKFLNEWLLRCLFQEPEDTPDGIVPFSPSRLWDKLDEEHWQRLKAECLSVVFQKHLGYFDGESKMLGSRNAVSNNAALLESYTESGVLLLDEAKTDLVSLRKKLDEQKARHEEAVKQANNAASGCIQGGLASIFQALELFCSEYFKAYNKSDSQIHVES